MVRFDQAVQFYVIYVLADKNVFRTEEGKKNYY